MFMVVSTSVYWNEVTKKSLEVLGSENIDSDQNLKAAINSCYEICIRFTPSLTSAFFSQWFLEWKRDDNAPWASGESEVQYVPWQSREMPRPSPIV